MHAPCIRIAAVYLGSMNMTEQLGAWGNAHAQARRAEHEAQQANDPESSRELRSKALSLREEADRLHREIYRRLERSDPDKHR